MILKLRCVFRWGCLLSCAYHVCGNYGVYFFSCFLGCWRAFRQWRRNDGWLSMGKELTNCFTVSLHSPNGRHCLPLGQCKELWVTFENYMHYSLPRMHGTCRYPLSIFRLANHTGDATSWSLAMSCTPLTVLLSTNFECETVYIIDRIQRGRLIKWLPLIWMTFDLNVHLCIAR